MDIKKLQKIFAERLTDLMTEKNYTITELATEAKLSPRTLYQWLRCDRTIQIDSLYKLSEFFNCTTDFLLGKEN